MLMRQIFIGILSVFFMAGVNAAVLQVPSEYSTIQAGIDAAEPGDRVLVANGLYTGIGNINLNFLGKAITVISESGPYGCIIDCEQMGRGVLFEGAEGDDSVFSGITVMNGYPDPDGDNVHGGAILVDGTGPVIEDCIFTGNTTDARGGAIYLLEGSARIANCIFDSNTASLLGGAVFSDGGTVHLVNCLVVDNISSLAGGGVLFSGGISMMESCTVTGNFASG
jgi:Right handed beta helix region